MVEAYNEALARNAVDSDIRREVQDAIRLLEYHGYTVKKPKTYSDDPTAPRVDEFGITVTQQGYDWSERMLDGDYVYALTHHSEPPDPADWDDFNDRDDFDGYDDDDEQEETANGNATRDQ